MSVIEGHLDAELLSAYLDDEVLDLEKIEIDGHLADCPSCLDRLEGLRRVTSTLQRLERAEPPPVLGILVQRRLGLDRQPGGVAGRWLRSTAWQFPISPPLATLFALVLALAIIVSLFGSALEWLDAREPILVPVFEDRPAAVVEPGDESDRRMVGGRSFALVDGRWQELGIGERAVRTVAADSPEALRLWQTEPELERAFAAVGVRLLIDGEVVEVVGTAEIAGAGGP